MPDRVCFTESWHLSLHNRWLAADWLKTISQPDRHKVPKITLMPRGHGCSWRPPMADDQGPTFAAAFRNGLQAAIHAQLSITPADSLRLACLASCFCSASLCAPSALSTASRRRPSPSSTAAEKALTVPRDSRNSCIGSIAHHGRMVADFGGYGHLHGFVRFFCAAILRKEIILLTFSHNNKLLYGPSTGAKHQEPHWRTRYTVPT